MRLLALALFLISSTAAGAESAEARVVRVEGHTLRNADGPFLGLGASYFQALRRAKFEPERFESDLAFLASKGFNFVRVLSMVGWFQAWEGKEIAPVSFKNRDGKSVEAWPDYWEQLARMIDRVYAHGMWSEITIFADARLMPAKGDRIAHMTKLLERIRGREHKIILLEVANEAWQNGFPGEQGVADLREFAKFLSERTAIPVAITSNHEDGEAGAVALYKNSAADIATWHFSRDIRAREGGWLPVRDCLWTTKHPDLPPFSSNEPIGPGSSVNSENDPIKLVMAAAFAWTAGLPMYVFHSGAGVFGREPLEKMAGVGDFIHLRKILPPDLTNWTRNDGKEAAAPFTTFSDDQRNKWWPEIENAKSGVVQNIGAAKGREFVALPVGILDGGVRLEARKAMSFRVYDPLSGEAVTNATLQAGAKFTLPRGPGAYIIRGEFSRE